MNEKESKWLFSEIHPTTLKWDTLLFWSPPTAKEIYSTGSRQGDRLSQQLLLLPFLGSPLHPPVSNASSTLTILVLAG